MARNYLQKIGYYGIEKLTDKELRKYYSSLRDIFQKQTKRLESVSPKEAKAFRPGGISYFGTIAEQKEKVSTAEELRRMLIKSAQALEGLTITRTKTGRIVTDTSYSVPSLAFKKAKISARDQAVLDSLHNSGFEHISKSTLKAFGNFMDEMRKQYGKRLPDSIIVAEFFDSLKYNSKTKGTSFLMDMWEDFKNNGYNPPKEQVNLFST